MTPSPAPQDEVPSLPSSDAAASIPRTTSASLLILTALWLAIYAAGMFTPPLLDDVDTIHAEAAREMLLRHDWVTMYTDGLRYLEKAPLMYWGLAASYEVFGISDWSTRLPLMLGVLALVLATYGLGSYALTARRGGFYSGLALVTSIGPYIFTRFLIPDVSVGLWLVVWLTTFSCGLLEEETPVAPELLGIRRSLRVERAHQGTDRSGVSHWRRSGLYLFLTRKLTPPDEAAIGFEYAGLSVDSGCAVAYSGGDSQPGAGAVRVDFSGFTSSMSTSCAF